MASIHPCRSASGHSTIRHARGLPILNRDCLPMLRSVPIELHPVADDISEDFARLRGFQREIEALCRVHALVPQNASDKFVFTGTVLQHEGTGGMTELVHGYPQPGRLLDFVDDLGAERNLFLVRAGLAGE